MTILELNSRFPSSADIDATWNRGLDSFCIAAGPARFKAQRG